MLIHNIKAAVKLLLARKEKRHPGPIRVVFLCQYIPAWNKVSPLYQQMLSDERFEPLLLCIPSDISHVEQNDTLDYYQEQGYPGIDARNGQGGWMDLRTLAPDYVFYLRPYDHVMPLEYASGNVCRYARICVIMYGMTMTKQIAKISIEPIFFRHVFFYFAENEYMRSLNRKHFPITHALHLRKTVHHGSPAMAQIIQDRDKPTDVWDFSDASFRIMWTPRWTTDLNLGGTNFFVYKDWILDDAAQHPDTAWLLRPHPLAFDTFVKAGDMTQAEVEDYRSCIDALPNVTLDTEKEYVASMWHSHALVSDISGILPEYFIMNKPLIFCRSNMILDPTDFTARLLEGCYCVDTPEQLQQCLDELRSGHDPLKDKRTAIIDELFGKTLTTSVSCIVNDLARSL